MNGEVTTLRQLRSAMVEIRQQLTSKVKTITDKLTEINDNKQDVLTGKTGQVVGFGDSGEPTAQDMDAFIRQVWPNGPYRFMVDENGCLIVDFVSVRGEADNSEN